MNRFATAALIAASFVSFAGYAQAEQPASPPDSATTAPASTVPAATAVPAVAATPMVIRAAPTADAMLPAGTSVRLRSLTPLHSQENRVGDRFDLEVVEDVMLNGMIVVPRGSPGAGEVVTVRRRGMWGRSGRLEVRLLNVRANGVTIPIRGGVADRGETGTAGVVASIVVLPIAGFFVTGTSATLPAGSAFTGQTESDLPVSFPDQAALQPTTLQATQPR